MLLVVVLEAVTVGAGTGRGGDGSGRQHRGNGRRRLENWSLRALRGRSHHEEKRTLCRDDDVEYRDDDVEYGVYIHELGDYIVLLLRSW